MKTYHISLSTNERISMVSNMSTMLAAGIPILETVNSLVDDARGNVKKFLNVLRDDLIQGNHLYVTFAKFPQIFNKVSVNVIKASEEAGALEIALKDLKENIKKEAEFSDKIKSAMIYPLLIMGVFIAVLLMILIVVVPKIASVFSRLKVPLPLPTIILMRASDLLLNHTLYVVGTIALFLGVFIFILKKKRDWVISFLSALPLISTLVREIDLTRFTRSLFLLLSSGITITQALELTQDVVVKSKMAKMIAQSRDLVLAGEKLSTGLRKYKGYVPSIMIKLIEVGEKSGTLDKSMKDIAEYMDYRVSSTLRTLTVLMEPILLLFVGVFIGGMMLAIIAPIYGIIGQVGNR